MVTGREWIVDACDCSAALLADPDVVRGVCDAVVETLGLRVVGTPQWHAFPAPGGVTGLYLLSESHLACHTWPETGLATFNLFCCRPRPEFPWRTVLRHALGALGPVNVQCVERGSRAANGGLIDEVPAEEPLAPELADCTTGGRA